MHDPMTLIGRWGPFELWHVDPQKGPGRDDSCGWFKRAHHGDAAVLRRVERAFEFEWDRIFESESGGGTYFRGLFCPNGDPHLSVMAIALNLFYLAAFEHFGGIKGKRSGEKARRFMRRHLWEILFFAENPTDSLFDAITQTFGGRPRREERIQGMAACVYGWILRADQRWWEHPRWHVRHWKLQCRWVSRLKRWLFTRCAGCGRRLAWGPGPERPCKYWPFSNRLR